MSDHIITALTLREASAQWTTLREKKGSLELAESCDVPLKLPDGVTDLSTPEGVAAFKAAGGGVKGSVSLALSTDQVLMRVVQFPTTDRAELHSMAELQVDKFCPFPLDHMLIGTEVLDQTESMSRVLIATAQKERVEKLGDILRKAGHAPRRVDVEIMGWWFLLKQQGAIAETGRQILLIVDGRSAELIIVQNGMPILFRALGTPSSTSVEEAATELADEIGYTLTTLESEWGPLQCDRVEFWHGDSVDRAIPARLGELCQLEIQPHHLEALPSLTEGLARRSVMGDAVLDLAPPEWRASIQSTKHRKTLVMTAGTLLAVWLVLLGVALGILEFRNRAFDRAKKEAAQLQGPATEVAEIRSQVEALKKYSDRSDSALECLRDVSERLPGGIELTMFMYKKFATLNIRGEADTSDPIYDFIQRLEDSKMYTEVKPEGVTDENRGGRRRAVFRVTCNLPVPEGMGDEESSP